MAPGVFSFRSWFDSNLKIVWSVREDRIGCLYNHYCVHHVDWFGMNLEALPLTHDEFLALMSQWRRGSKGLHVTVNMRAQELEAFLTPHEINLWRF